MIMSRENMELKDTPYIPQEEGKTLCSDPDTCESLNHFLDTGYGVPPTLCFGIQCTDNYISATIDLNKFGVREKAEVIGRLVHFVMNELNRIKNVQ